MTQRLGLRVILVACVGFLACATEKKAAVGPQTQDPNERQCPTGSDGQVACGYNCQMGADGHEVCSNVPGGSCALGADGRVTCFQGPAAQSTNAVPDASAKSTCNGSVDCANGAFCKDRGDGIKVCMGNGGAGAYCLNGADCLGGLTCKPSTGGFKACK